MIKHFILFVILWTGTLMSGQELEWSGSVSTAGVVSSESALPFWMHTNTSTTWAEESQFSMLGGLDLTKRFSDSSYIKLGSVFFFRDQAIEEFQRRDLFLEYQNKWVSAILGSKVQRERAQGLSASNKNFLFSRNSRPLPGLYLFSPTSIELNRSFSVDWELAHYNLNDDRYTLDTKVHFKRLTLNFKLKDESVLKGSIQHYAQWGGVSPDTGAFPDDFSAFIKVFFATKGAETSEDDELQNAVGNHLGSYFLEYQRPTKLGELAIYHEHPFEDGSGSRGVNVPDGIYGIHFKPKNKRFIDGILYEFITTVDQSGIDGGRGYDNYFGNSGYRSGWTYEGRVIGLPFILVDNERELNDTNNPLLSNSLNLHHLGVTGGFGPFQWKVLSSYVIQKGTLRIPFDPEIRIWSNYGSLTYSFDEIGSIRLFGAIDTGAKIQNTIAAGLEYSYSF